MSAWARGSFFRCDGASLAKARSAPGQSTPTFICRKRENTIVSNEAFPASGGLVARQSGYYALAFRTSSNVRRVRLVAQAVTAMPAAEEQKVLDGKTVAVVGGGPAGLLAAAQLAKLGAKARHPP